ncbi:MAG: hypothetical protein JO197_03110 [Acidobacteria bacterium]|nr:hypothetical protein [Acidobacteriota bacterium]MBV9476628.1 hypothetical protein [Acidobacteriota bacterium]
MNDDLTRLLRAHDPAAGKTLHPATRARLFAERAAPRRVQRWRVAVVAAALVLLAGIAALVRRPDPEPPRRQIQYATKSGTRIIWTLDPNFRM